MTIGDWLFYGVLSFLVAAFGWATYMSWRASRRAYWFDIECDIYGPYEAHRRLVEGRQGEPPPGLNGKERRT